MRKINKKKLAVIGKTVAGCLSIGYFLSQTEWDIDWYVDPDDVIQDQDLSASYALPLLLAQGFNFDHTFLSLINGSYKTGTYKKDWKGTGSFYFSHVPPLISYHYNTAQLIGFCTAMIQDNNRVQIFEKKVMSADVTADFVMNCSSTPGPDELYYESTTCPINRMCQLRSDWEGQRFSSTLVLARPYGVIHVIPLYNRCTVYYTFNSNFSSDEEIMNDLKVVCAENNITCNDNVTFSDVRHYMKKEVLIQHIAYNGNACMSIDLLEAGDVGTYYKIIHMAHDYWSGVVSRHKLNNEFLRAWLELETIINLHYFAGSIYETPFWANAEKLGLNYIKLSEQEQLIREPITLLIHSKNPADYLESCINNKKEIKDIAGWDIVAMNLHCTQLDLYEKIENLNLCTALVRDTSPVVKSADADLTNDLDTD